MSQTILPEGRLLYTYANRASCSTPAGLHRALEREEILEGVALRSDPDGGLLVSAGPYLGHIPREETAFGLQEGRIREISVLTRVGRPISFTVTGIKENAGDLRLTFSRRRAQELAWSHLSTLPLGSVIPATVSRLEAFGVFVDIGCGLTSLLRTDRISMARIRHPNQRFQPGQEIWAVILRQDPTLFRLELTHRELLGTWAENAAQFAPGMAVPGIVRGTMDYGLFVELLPNLTGLAEPHGGIREGDRVTVYIKSLYPEAGKCKLLILGKLPPAPLPPIQYTLPEGMRLTYWNYAPQRHRPSDETRFEAESEA